MKTDFFQEALKYYNDCFARKAVEDKMEIGRLRDALKQHKVKGFENCMFCYFFCLYYSKGMSDAQWLQFVKSEARYGLMEAIEYCVNKGIDPIEDHFNIYFIDRTFAHEFSQTKKVLATVVITSTSDYEQSKGWGHGYIIPISPICYGYIFNSNKSLFTIKFLELEWSKLNKNLDFPHSHYTIDDLNHWNDINKVESEQFISIIDYGQFPAFSAIEALNNKIQIPLSDTSKWFLPSIHTIKRLQKHTDIMTSYGVDRLWTSSQCDDKCAVSFDPHRVHSGSYSSLFNNDGFYVENKSKHLPVLPVA